MVPFGAVPCSCLKIGMETFQIISMEHKISQARLAHVKPKNQYFLYLRQDIDGCCTLWSQTMIITVFLCVLHHSAYIFFSLKIMTAVTSQQSFPEMIKEIPPGHAKELVLRLCGQTHRWVELFWHNILLT